MTAVPSAAPPTSGVLGNSGRVPVRVASLRALRLGPDRTPLLPVGPLRMYTCGITPYDVTHVGHAATFVWADLIASVAAAVGGEALMARNVTDIDDVLTEAARSRGRHYDELALTQEFHFDRDMRALAVTAPAYTPRARAHVPAVLRLTAALLEAGAAYTHRGFVYFRGAQLPRRLGLTDDEALAALELYGDLRDVPGRESPFDVTVWRPSAEDHPAWPSPWGWGRPGWHAECAAMALSSLGAVDVLVGGVDLTFPHHAYQVAMAEAATGVRPFARAVVHVGEVRYAGAKMAKSTGNLVLVGDLLGRHSGPAIRLGLLHRRHQEPWECEERVFTDAADQLEELTDAAGPAPAEVDAEVVDALTELDVPAAVARARGAGGSVAAYLVRILKLRW